MFKGLSNSRKGAAKKSTKDKKNYVECESTSSGRSPAPVGKPVTTEPDSSKAAVKSESKRKAKGKSIASFTKTTKGKWACAAAALVLAVGIGGAVGGTGVSTDATTHALVSTGELSQSSQSASPYQKAAEEAAKKAATQVAAEAEAKEKAEAEKKAKADAETKAAVEAETAAAKAQAQAQAQAQQPEAEVAAAAAASTAAAPQAAQESVARSSGGGSASAAPAPSSGGGGDTVYVTKSGECYHRDGCSSLKKSKIPMSRSEAASRYRPCSNCNP